MRRRDFITLLGGAASAWPLAARAQQAERMRRVGVLMAWLDTDPDIQARVAAFRQELRKLGWTEGVNLHIEERFGGDDMDHLRAQAAELIELKVDAILVAGRRAVSVLRQQTRSIPIVLAGISDPAGQGLVASLARPGGNITGFSMFEFSVIGKMLEMLKQTAPGIAGTASGPDMLTSSSSLNDPFRSSAQTKSRTATRAQRAPEWHLAVRPSAQDARH